MNHRDMRGFSLLEVLITILLTAIGILGMVAMQGRAIQYTQDSVQRTQAVILASELLEIVRTNPGSLEADSDDSPLFASLPTSANGDCLEAGNPTTLVGDQLACWARKVRLLLPGADEFGNQIYSCLSSAPGTCNDNAAAIEIQLAWRAVGNECPQAGDSTPEFCTYRFRTQI
ncbi:type IV pilus modification protein PilV [Halopseudomonas phragmitis]|uniref:Type IV pilus modification protein PilV n=1 Tax=Halopseudomonas phragmitis TaxID=1931241 RepID=A0A1V0B4C7_9GAMM|nr:type IV pilus modification protein PilV [Halopseudomonas phragmitis]AQZ94765.1 type IV pilus modification protein PilV [Halopseudomonas phragmitis]